MAVCSAAAAMPLIVRFPTAESATFEWEAPIEKDLVADFGGSLNAWNAWLTSTQVGTRVTLTIPAGTWVGNRFSWPNTADGPRFVIIEGAGADVTSVKVEMLFTATGSQENGPWPRIASARIGDTTVAL